VVASVLSFLAYDYFFVPPVGQLDVSAPQELLGLVLLLAAALVTGELAATTRRSREAAERAATSARSLNELATAALQFSDPVDALKLVANRATALRSVSRFTVVAGEGSELHPLAGAPLDAETERDARWALQSGSPIGVRVGADGVHPVQARPARTQLAVVPMRNGVVVLGLDPSPAEPDDGAMLTSTVSVAGLLLDRWAAARESERVRSLQSSDTLKSAILSSISHELKTPVAILRTGVTSLLVPEASVGQRERELLTGLDDEIVRLGRLIGDLLTMSRLEAGLPAALEPRSLDEVLGPTLERIRPRLAGRVLAVELPDDLPPVQVDEVLIDQVLTNLLDNAIEWTPPGGRITLKAARGDGLMNVSVENEGIHIAPRDLAVVFDKFWTKRSGGTGLGLAISKRIVEAHGGTIRADNVRAGPRFTFTLPIATAVPVQ
jgi:two-component system sensor histidine kinase KdpD